MDNFSLVHQRLLKVCTFSNEKVIKPENKTLSWTEIVALHQKPSIRALKSGAMFAGYPCDGDRSNKNVAFRSLIQLDIDTMVKKDPATGKVTIIKQAPMIQEIWSRIAQYEWFAVSSHGHDIGQGIVKYRIVMLPDRDIFRNEYRKILEAIDVVLGGILDRGAWQWSQAFFLPSCPERTEYYSFFHHNQGKAFPINEVFNSNETFSAHKSTEMGPSSLSSALVGGITLIPEEPEHISKLFRTLEFLDADTDRSSWRNVVWSIAAHGWVGGKKIAYDWSSKGQKWDEAEFENVWNSYDPKRSMGIGHRTVYFMAHKAGALGSAVNSEQLEEGQRDIRNAKAFARANIDKLLFIHDTGDYLQFQKTGWAKAKFGFEMQLAQAVLAGYFQDVTDLYSNGEVEKAKQLANHVKQSSVKQRLDAMINLANKEPGMSRGLSELDTNASLLGVFNGIIDLHSCCLVDSVPSLLVTKRANVIFDSKADCPNFKEFLKQVQPSKDVRFLLQQLAGIFLSGNPEIQKIIFFYGHGANGKSTFMELLARIMGDYSLRIQTELLMQHQRNPQGPSPDLVALKGVRLAFCQEVGEGQKLADARVKELTGGDTLTGRIPYAKSAITFEPSHNLVIVGNHKPEIHDMSHGMWRRVLLIEWTVEIAEGERDPNMLDKLMSEAAGILNWMLEGFSDFRKYGLIIPSIVQAANDAYKDDEDLLGDWICDACRVGSTEMENASKLYNSYKYWCELHGHKPSSQTKLTRRLTERGYKRDAGKRNIKGISLVRLGPPYPDSPTETFATFEGVF